MRTSLAWLAALGVAACSSDPTPATPASSASEPAGPTAPSIEIASRDVSLSSDREALGPRTGFHAFVIGSNTMSSASPTDTTLQPVLDAPKWTCPWTPSEEIAKQTKLVTTRDGRAFFTNPRCGAWSISLEKPSDVTEIVKFDEPEYRSIALSQDSRFGCMGGEFGTELFRTSGDFDLGKSEPCLDVTILGNTTYIAVDGGLFSQTVGTNEVERVEGVDHPQGFQVGNTGQTLYFLDDNGLERLDVGAKTPQLIDACDKEGGLNARECPAFLVNYDSLYLVRSVDGHNELVVRNEKDGTEKSVYRTADNESIHIPAGLALTESTSQQYIWFVLDWRTAPNAEPTKTYLSRFAVGNR